MSEQLPITFGSVIRLKQKSSGAFLKALAEIHPLPSKSTQQIIVAVTEDISEEAGVLVPYEHLLTLEKNGDRDFTPVGSARRRNVSELLSGIEDPWQREFGESHLYPPLFVISPETSFATAWEVFCCDVINRFKQTSEIYRRKPPESGIDLYWSSERTAYQCKSVEESTNRFSVSKAVESLEAAKSALEKIPWEKYVICSNVAITGPQEDQLRKICPEIEFYTPSFWIPRCREQSAHLGARFMKLTSFDGSPSR